jgi:hypothetical protein
MKEFSVMFVSHDADLSFSPEGIRMSKSTPLLAVLFLILLIIARLSLALKDPKSPRSLFILPY